MTADAGAGGPATSDLLIRGAAVLSSAHASEATTGDILIRGGVIAAVGTVPEPRDDVPVLDARGCMAIPGLVNAHLHSPGNLMRGTLDGLPLELFMLREVPPLARGEEDPDLVRVRTLLGAAEMLKLGITSVLDDAFFVPLVSSPAVDALAGAYAEIGMRATLTLDQPIVPEFEKYPYLADLLPQRIRREMLAAPRETAEGMLAHYERLIERWNGAADGLIGAAVSSSAVQRATPDYLVALASLAREHDLTHACHILETRLQRVLGEERYGRSLVRVAHDLGVLDAQMQVIHAVWIDDDDIGLLAESGACVAHNPVCNLRLGSGVMPFRALRDAGVPICLGTDEAISDDSHDLWGAIKLAGTLHAIATPDPARWPSAAEVLEAVWDGGDRAMRRSHRLGRIEPGASGDIALLDADAPAFLPLHDLRRQLVLAGAGGAVRHTVVAGRIAVEDGRVRTIDEAALVAEVRAIEPMLRRAAADLAARSAELEPYYRAMLDRSLAQGIGVTRRLDR